MSCKPTSVHSRSLQLNVGWLSVGLAHASCLAFFTGSFLISPTVLRIPRRCLSCVRCMLNTHDAFHRTGCGYSCCIFGAHAPHAWMVSTRRVFLLDSIADTLLPLHASDTATDHVNTGICHIGPRRHSYLSSCHACTSYARDVVTHCHQYVTVTIWAWRAQM